MPRPGPGAIAGNVPLPRANPIAGTQTALAIPGRGPWPPAPPPTPQQQPGMTIAGIPLPRPRPQMPGTPPPQIPQPGTIPQPAAVPRPNMPMPGQAGVPMPDVSRATGALPRTNATPGPLGGTQMPPGATGGVRLLDAVPPQTTSQGGPVPPPTPSQTVSPAQILADQVHNSPATGMVPTSSGDAGAPAVTRGLMPLARPPIAVPNASFADRFQASQPAQGQDAVNAALLEYLRQQAQQQQQNNSPDYGSYAGAY
jgi:hypothetical protein